MKRVVLLFAAAYAAFAVVGVVARPVEAARPGDTRDQADCVFSGTVKAVYARDTTGYRQYVVEIGIEQVAKGAGLNKGDTFRAFCYQRKAGAGGLEFDTAGHNAIPREGQRIRAFVKSGRGRNEGVYPDWFDVIRATNR
jgi:hypothetical protein